MAYNPFTRGSDDPVAAAPPNPSDQYAAEAIHNITIKANDQYVTLFTYMVPGSVTISRNILIVASAVLQCSAVQI